MDLHAENTLGQVGLSQIGLSQVGSSKSPNSGEKRSGPLSGGGLILIADDEAPIRMVVGEKLRTSGFEVQEAPDGEEALEKALARRPRLIVTDLQMPYMSGLDLAQRIAGDSRTAGVPMILLTARGHVLNQSLMEGTSIRKIMSKPFSARELVSVISQLLQEEAGTVGSVAAGAGSMVASVAPVPAAACRVLPHAA